LAKVKSPLFSIVAMGTVDKSLIYRKRKGINDVKKYTKTINPNTPGQQGQKGFFKEAIEAWNTDGYNFDDLRAWNIYARLMGRSLSGINIYSSNRINALKVGNTWNSLTNCIIYDVTGVGFKVDIDIGSDQLGKLYIGKSKYYMAQEFAGVFSGGKYTFTITGLEMLKEYFFYVKNTSANENGRTGIYKQKTLASSPPVPIYIGNEAISRLYNGATSYTLIEKINPANETGKITSVEIWARSNLTGCKVGIFYLVSGNLYSTRDWVNIGLVTAGSKQSFPTDLNVEIGDFIGIYYSPGNIAYSIGISGNSCYKSGDHIPCTNFEFSTNGSYIMSLYGIGAV